MDREYRAVWQGLGSRLGPLQLGKIRGGAVSAKLEADLGGAAGLRAEGCHVWIESREVGPWAADSPSFRRDETTKGDETMDVIGKLHTVLYDRCDDGSNWHVMAPSGHLMDSYRDKGEAEMVAEDRNHDIRKEMEAVTDEEAEMVADDVAASRRRWELRQSPITASVKAEPSRATDGPFDGDAGDETMTHDELKEAYEAYFKLRMKEPEFARMVAELGPHGLTALHDMLFRFFQAGAVATGSH